MEGLIRVQTQWSTRCTISPHPRERYRACWCPWYCSLRSPSPRSSRRDVKQGQAGRPSLSVNYHLTPPTENTRELPVRNDQHRSNHYNPNAGPECAELARRVRAVPAELG